MLATIGRTIQFWDRLTETPVDVPVSALALQGFREWAHSDQFPESGRICFLNGEIFIDMSPEDLESHNLCKFGLYHGWGRFLTEFDIGDAICDGMLLINDDADLGTESDGLICLHESVRAGRVQYREKVEGSERYVEVVGSPDVAAEVVSRTSARKDTIVLMGLYYAAGVSEYWLIDARQKDQIDFRIDARGATHFERVTPDAEGFTFSQVLGRSFRMTRTRNAGGRWRYSLEFR